MLRHYLVMKTLSVQISHVNRKLHMHSTLFEKFGCVLQCEFRYKIFAPLIDEISNNMVCATSKASDQPAHMRSLIRAFALLLEYFMIVKLLTEHHLEFLSLKEGCTGSSDSTHLKMSHCRKSHATAQICSFMIIYNQLTLRVDM